MAPPSARNSFRFALQRELLKLYLVVLAGLAVLTVTEATFHFITIRRLRTLVRFPFMMIGWGLIVGGAVGVLHYVFTQTAIHTDQ